MMHNGDEERDRAVFLALLVLYALFCVWVVCNE